MTAGQPLSLRVDGLKNAWLENTSSEPQFVLHSLNIQPSRLRLYGSDGRELSALDSRSRKKFDTRVSKSDYLELSPQGKAALFQARLKDFSGSYELIWGPFSFAGLAPGNYQATLEWQSERNDYSGEAGDKQRLLGVWLGTVQTQRFTVSVP